MPARVAQAATRAGRLHGAARCNVRSPHAPTHRKYASSMRNFFQLAPQPPLPQRVPWQHAECAMFTASAPSCSRRCMYRRSSSHGAGKKSIPHEHGSCCAYTWPIPPPPPPAAPPSPPPAAPPPPPRRLCGPATAYRSMCLRGIVNSTRRGVYSEMPSRLEGGAPPPPPSVPSAYTWRSRSSLASASRAAHIREQESSSSHESTLREEHHVSLSASHAPSSARGHMQRAAVSRIQNDGSDPSPPRRSRRAAPATATHAWFQVVGYVYSAHA
jgi:hypothetical protein